MSKSLVLRWEVEERSPFWIVRKGDRSFVTADGRRLTRMQERRWLIEIEVGQDLLRLQPVIWKYAIARFCQKSS